MEGATRLGEGISYEVPWVRKVGAGGAVPALLLLYLCFSSLLFVTGMVSVASYDDRYALVFLPPSGDAYASFVEVPGRLLVDTVARLAPPLLLAAFPASGAGYFLATKAPGLLRRVGVFLLLGAWALTFERNLAMSHLLARASLASWIPWMAIGYPGATSTLLFYTALPIIALCVYSSLRGGFLGLVWPAAEGSVGDRFARGHLPRAASGVALGVLIAGAFGAVDPLIVIFGGAREPGIGSYLFSQAFLVGGAPQAAAAATVVFVLLVAAFLAFAGWLWVLRFVTRHSLPLPGEDVRTVSRIPRIAAETGGAAFAFLVVSAFLPIGIAAVFSFNSFDSISVFRGWTTDWYFNPEFAPGSAERIGVLNEQSRFLDTLTGAAGLSALLALAVVPFAVLVAASVWNLAPRSRGIVRALLYMGLVVPVALTSLMAYFGPVVGSASISIAPLEPPWDAVPIAVALLPFGLAVAFVVAASSSDWRQAWSVGGGWMPWLRPASAAFLVTFGFLLSSFGAFTKYSATTYVAGRFSVMLLSPFTDAALVLLTFVTLVPILAGMILVGGDDRELFRL
ncbi:MAG: hypothetical protein ACT4OI_05295 [Methanobacteriota archaeon]